MWSAAPQGKRDRMGGREVGPAQQDQQGARLPLGLTDSSWEEREFDPDVFLYWKNWGESL